MSWKEGSEVKFLHNCAICSFKNLLLPTVLGGFWRGRALPEVLGVSLLKRHCQEFFIFRNPVCSFFFSCLFFFFFFFVFSFAFCQAYPNFPFIVLLSSFVGCLLLVNSACAAGGSLFLVVFGLSEREAQ